MSSLQVFFDGIDTQLANLVTLIVTGKVLAKGLTSIGAIDIIISGSQSSGLGITGMTLIITAVIVALAGISNVSTIEVVKRTAIPMTLALITTLVGTFLFIH